jgi:EF-P beta-lysylation protein EpmB
MRERLDAPWPAGAWRSHLATAVTDLDELLGCLDLDPSCVGDIAEARLAAHSFGLRVPRGYVDRMRRGDPSDPLLRQVLPLDLEGQVAAGYSTDPLAELEGSRRDRLLQKYSGRALVVVTGACAVHCRYCFRRHFPYAEHRSMEDDFEGAVSQIADDPTLVEIILSGGDPLMLPDTRLEALGRRLAAVPHVRRLRLHTRLPIVLPQRVDGELTSWIGGLGLPVVIVVHANHANEIDGNVRRAMSALAATGVVLLNQAVLLAGVNDSVGALVDLSEALFAAGVLPYYLHLLDPVAGAAHFDLPDTTAKELMDGVRSRLPGYLVPRLVREVPGAPSKLPADLWS